MGSTQPRKAAEYAIHLDAPSGSDEDLFLSIRFLACASDAGDLAFRHRISPSSTAYAMAEAVPTLSLPMLHLSFQQVNISLTRRRHYRDTNVSG